MKLARAVRISLAVLCLGAVGLGVLAGSGQGVAEAGDGWWGALDEGEAVSLSNVIRAPREYRGRTITFFCVFYTAAGEFKYYPPNTAFTESLFINFAVWPDGVPVWEEKTYIGNFPFFYLRRTNEQRSELARVKRYTRLECTGRIRDIVRGRPAIEVFSFRETGHRLGEPVVNSIKWGLNHARLGTKQGYQSAAGRFKEALQPDLPPAYALIVRKYLGDSLRKLGLDDEAALYEGGETIGTPPLPTPEDGGGFADLGPPPAGPGEFPNAPPQGPDASGSPDGASGSPDGPRPSTGRLPTAPRGMDDLPQPPSDNPFASSDLPGRTVDPRSLPEPPPAGKTPSGRRAQPRTPRKPVSGIPPKRRPRLSGVK